MSTQSTRPAACASCPSAPPCVVPTPAPPRGRTPSSSRVLAAQKAIQEMYDRGRTLHFSMDSGRVKILLQDLDGNVIREVPSSKVVDIANQRVDD